MSETLGIRVLAEQVGLAPHTLRYYEDAGLMLNVPRDGTGRRAYTADHVRWVKFLLNLREGGMGIAQMRRYVDLIQSETDGGLERFEMLEAHREKVKRRLETLGDHLKVLNRKLAAGCGPDQQGSQRR